MKPSKPSKFGYKKILMGKVYSLGIFRCCDGFDSG